MFEIADNIGDVIESASYPWTFTFNGDIREGNWE